MGEWKKFKLGEIVTFQRGFDITQKEQVPGFFPVVSSSGIKSYHNQFKVNGPGVVIGRKGTLGTVFYLENEFWPHDTTLWVKDFKGNYPNFIYYFLKTFGFENYDVGSSNPTLNRNHIHQLYALLPPLNEQHAIASILSSLDDKIELLHHQNAILETMAETLFKQWFVEEAKEDWEEIKIKDFPIIVTDFVANGSFASLKENVTLITDREDYALFIRNTDLKSNFKSKTYVNKHSYDFLKKTKLYGGEVIISSVGDVGSVFRCPNFNIPMTLGNNVIMLKSDFNYFFYLFFKSEYGQNLIYGITSGSVQEKFNKTVFRNLVINYPSLDYVKEFENRVKSFFNKIDLIKTQIDTLTIVRDTLLPKLMSGEVRVKI